jgi:hypothetical protein
VDETIRTSEGMRQTSALDLLTAGGRKAFTSKAF